MAVILLWLNREMSGISLVLVLEGTLAKQTSSNLSNDSRESLSNRNF